MALPLVPVARKFAENIVLKIDLKKDFYVVTKTKMGKIVALKK